MATVAIGAVRFSIGLWAVCFIYIFQKGDANGHLKSRKCGKNCYLWL